MDWLSHQPLLIHLKAFNTTIVHAGLSPDWTLKRAILLSQEVSECLNSAQGPEFLKAMYGNEPCGWSDDLNGFDRLRVITNYLTRVRIIDIKGQMQLTYKGNRQDIPEGYMPWFNHPHRQYACETQVVFGHWAALMGNTQRSDCIALDTGCVWGKQLTALCLDTNQTVSCQCP